MKSISVFIQKQKIFDWYALVLAVTITLSPFVVNHHTLPMGWEVPKVWFLWGAMALLGILAIACVLANTNSKQLDFTIKQFLTQHRFWVAILLPLLLAVVITWRMDPQWQDIKLWGNVFRYQGLITMLLLLSNFLGIIAVFPVRRLNWVVISFVISGFTQALIGWQQFIEVAQIMGLDAATSSTSVFGTFGQINFWSGRVILAIFLTCWLIYKYKQYLKVLVGLMLVILLMLLIVLISGSDWAKITLVISFGTLLLAYILPQRAFLPVFIFSRLSMFVALPVLAVKAYREGWVNDHRLFIWSQVAKAIDTTQLSPQLILGHGFDVMAEVFNKERLAAGGYIDRAHNLTVDIFFSTGLIGLAAAGAFLGRIYTKLGNFNKDMPVLILFLAWDLLLVRAIVHTSSIINVYDLVIMTGLVWITLIKK